ncbi:MAG: hypothetical protein LBR73_04035 [Oscillospiraceae bacterium]|jgi:O-glycosyl hydrolase|nr:hypothetical protein [Oscillospiraceae bacterium]
MPSEIIITPEKTFQTIEGFGASGAWTAQEVGAWPEKEREAVAKLLFDKTEGLGLNIWRYNIGSGSKQSGKGNFPNPRRATVAFTAPNEPLGTFDFSRDAEAMWFVRRAAAYGADEIVFFVNSPLERFTITGTAQGKIPFHKNLKRSCEKAFVRYLLDVTEHFVSEGLPIRFLSPVNEPFGPWIAKTGQEGCHYSPAGVRRLFRLCAQEMDKRPGLDNVKLSGAENNDLRLMNKSYTRAVLCDRTIRARMDGIDVHGYVFGPLAKLKGVRERFRKYLDKRFPNEKVRMSEWTHMVGGRGYGMDSALEQARTMCADLSILNAVSWQCWIAVSEVQFHDGLIYIDLPERKVSLPKRYAAFGNFSRFVRRGAVRIGCQYSDADLNAVAFVEDSQTVLVIVNTSQTDKPIRLSGADGNGKMFITDERHNLAVMEITSQDFTLPALSVCTLQLIQPTTPPLS